MIRVRKVVHVVHRGMIGAGLVLTALVLTAGCGSDATTSPAVQAFPRRLSLNHHAITLATVAPYDTIRLDASVVDQTGAPFSTTERVVYTASDTSVIIDSTGRLRVHWSGSDVLNITVVARLRTTGTRAATLVDTAIVNVVNWSSAAAVPAMDSLLLRPLLGDSARLALFDTTGPQGGSVVPQTLDSPVAKTALGVALDKIVVRYQSSDSLIASFVTLFGDAMTPPQVAGQSPGVVLLTAEATVYGKRRVDSLLYTVGYPLRVICIYGLTGRQSLGFGPVSNIPKANSLSLGGLVVSQGGVVLWENSVAGRADDSLDIQFDDPTHVSGVTRPTSFPDLSGNPGGIIVPPGPGGNISSFPAAVATFTGSGQDTFFHIKNDSTTSKARVFTRPGTYHWSSQRQGISGTVTVIPNDSLRQK